MGSSSLKPPNLPPQEPQTMKLLFPPNPLKYSPPLLSYDRVLAGGVSGFQPESVNPVNELEFSVSSLEKLSSQSVFYQKSTELIPEMVSERFIAGSPPSLLWSAPKLNPNGDSGQRVQGGVRTQSVTRSKAVCPTVGLVRKPPVQSCGLWGQKKELCG